MGRSILNGLFLILVLVIAVFVGAGVKEFMLRSAPVAENNQGLSQNTQGGNPYAIAGWCCQQPGSNCASSDSPLTCLRGGGKSFNIKQQTCDATCHAIKH